MLVDLGYFVSPDAFYYVKCFFGIVVVLPALSGQQQRQGHIGIGPAIAKGIGSRLAARILGAAKFGAEQVVILLQVISRPVPDYVKGLLVVAPQGHLQSRSLL